MFRPAILCLLLAVALGCSGCMMPNHEVQLAENEAQLKREGIVALTVGAAAPPLTGAVDGAGAAVTPEGLLAAHKAGVILFFFPALDTPNSSANLVDLDKRRAALEAEGLGVYAVCPAAAAQSADYFKRLGLSLPLLADPAGTVASAYGCLPPVGAAPLADTAGAAPLNYPQRTVVVIGDKAGISYFHRGTLDQPAVEKACGLAATDKK